MQNENMQSVQGLLTNIVGRVTLLVGLAVCLLKPYRSFFQLSVIYSMCSEINIDQ